LAWLDEAMEDDDKHSDASAAADRDVQANFSKCRPQLTTIVHACRSATAEVAAKVQEDHKDSLRLSQCRLQNIQLGVQCVVGGGAKTRRKFVDEHG